MTRDRYLHLKRLYFSAHLYRDDITWEVVGFIAESDSAIPELEFDPFVANWSILGYRYLYHVFAPKNMKYEEIL